MIEPPSIGSRRAKCPTPGSVTEKEKPSSQAYACLLSGGCEPPGPLLQANWRRCKRIIASGVSERCQRTAESRIGIRRKCHLLAPPEVSGFVVKCALVMGQTLLFDLTSFNGVFYRNGIFGYDRIHVFSHTLPASPVASIKNFSCGHPRLQRRPLATLAT